MEFGSSAVIAMCLWNRPSHFRTMLENFAKQDYSGGIILGLWNNDRKNTNFYEQEIKKFIAAGNTGAIKRVHIFHSPLNTGGAGRFYMGKKLVHQYRQPFIIFIDDDQVIKSDWISQLMMQAEPQTQKSWWAWHVKNEDYWDRDRARPGETVDYAATCGMICDASILNDNDLYRKIPKEYWFLEDIWLNHIGLLHGHQLKALDTQMEFVLEETNQYHKLIALKPTFYKLLIEERK